MDEGDWLAERFEENRPATSTLGEVRSGLRLWR
jgi:hypothetical protein